MHTLYSRKKNPKTGKRKVLGRYRSMEAAEKRERQVQYFKGGLDELADFAKSSIYEEKTAQTAKRTLGALAGGTLGALSGFLTAPFGYKTRAALGGGAAGVIGGGFSTKAGIPSRYGLLAGPAAGIGLGTAYRKRASKAKKIREQMERARKAMQRGPSYSF